MTYSENYVASTSETLVIISFSGFMQHKLAAKYGDRKFLRILNDYLQIDMASYPKRLQSPSKSMWKKKSPSLRNKRFLFALIHSITLVRSNRDPHPVQYVHNLFVMYE